MRISFFFVAIALSAPAATAQTPPSRPAPARRPIAPRPLITTPTPLPPPPEWDFRFEPQFSLAPMVMPDWHFDLTLPAWEHLNWEFDLPHEPLLPELADVGAQLEQLAPMPPVMAIWPGEMEIGSPHGKLSTLRPDQGTPEDSLFRAAREALNRGEYARASTLFQTFEQKYPRSRVAPSALYYRAFALYRAGATEELRAALAALKTQQERYPEAASDPDAATLRTRVYAALAARGDAQAATALRAANSTGESCDKEDMEVRAEALNALAQMDAPEARPTLKRVLARRDECSVTLRRRAVYILGRNGTEESAADLLEVAKNDPDAGVRSDAIMLIARSPGAATVKTLEQLFNESQDARTREAALSALRAKGGPEAKRVLRAIIEKSDLPERTRAEAVLQLASLASSGESWSVGNREKSITMTRNPDPEGGQEDAAFLRGIYGKTDSRTIKAAVLVGVSRIGGAPNDQWLMSIAKNREEDSSLRREALSRIKASSLSIDELSKLFDALSERELRSAVVSQLARRDDPAAVDKLIEIVRSGTDPQIRRQALGALTQKKDPRTMKLLLELVEKP